MAGKIEDPSGIPSDDFEREALIDRLQQYLQADPKAWNVRYNLGVALAHAGRQEEALAQFREVLKVSPRHMETLINIGGLHLSRGEADLALKAFTNALVVWDTPLVRANLAVAYLQLGRLEEAVRHLRQALEQNPAMPDAWSNLGSALLQLGRIDESIEASQKALEHRPEFGLAHNNLAVAFLEKKDLETARHHAHQAQEQGYPVHGEMLARLGMEPPQG